MRAVLLDVDGVLLDTGALFRRVWTEWAVARDLDPALVLLETAGRRSADTVRAVAPRSDVAAECRELDRLVTTGTGEVRAMPGAADLLAGLRVPWALVTSGSRWFVQRSLRSARLPVPPAAVFGEDVEHGKPAPDPYLAGAELMGVAPEQCVVVEDAPAGVAAAKAAGCTVVAVTTTHRARDLVHADTCLSTLAEVGSLLRTMTSPGAATKENR